LKKKITIISITGLFISTIVLVNFELVIYREKEILFNLDIISRQLQDMKTTSLLARYKIIKNRIKNGEQESDYITEAKIQGVLNSNYYSEISTDESNIFIRKHVEFLTKIYLKGIRLFLGKKMPETIHSAYNNPFLELAFFYERYRKFEKAIEVMQNIARSKKNLTSFSRRYILLHTGFCYSMMSKYDLSEKSYITLISIYPESNEAETAKLLLLYLNVMKDGTDSILKQTIPEIKKAEKLYLLSSYLKARLLYDKILKSDKLSPSEYFKARFYRGRSSEETGSHDIAINDYKSIIKNLPGSDLAVKSNMRLMILGAFYREGKNLVKTAEKNISNAKDKKNIIAMSKIKDKMMTDTFPSKKINTRYEIFKKNIPEESISEEDLFQIKDQGSNDERAVTSVNSYSSLRKINKIENFNEIVNKKLLVDKQKKTGRKVNIKSKNGFFFSGEIIHEDDKIIVIKSEFGEIPLKKDMIHKITNIE